MKHIIVLICIISAALHAVEGTFPNFGRMSKREAATAARKQAETDFAEGHYRMLVFGLRAVDSAHDKRLAKEGVEVKAIAGCIVSEGILEGARVYNQVMREKLKTKLGRDIFADKDEALKGNQK